ncbi:MAG TPA: hypothetical protein VFV58_09110 [Blastocatellia bacterium]|jgi:hypothetical protein|nr:hypothetical protein [Blastocatellia bacterium]
MNLILPVMEIGVIGEALRLAGAIGLALLSQLGRRRERMGVAARGFKPPNRPQSASAMGPETMNAMSD